MISTCKRSYRTIKTVVFRAHMKRRFFVRIQFEYVWKIPIQKRHCTVTLDHTLPKRRRHKYGFVQKKNYLLELWTVKLQKCPELKHILWPYAYITYVWRHHERRGKYLHVSLLCTHQMDEQFSARESIGSRNTAEAQVENCFCFFCVTKCVS